MGEKYWEFDINKKDTGDNEKRKKDRERLKCKYKNGNREENLKKITERRRTGSNSDAERYRAESGWCKSSLTLIPPSLILFSESFCSDASQRNGRGKSSPCTRSLQQISLGCT